MFLVGLISWWYGKGCRQFVRGIWMRLGHTADFFSVGILLKTLFSPFRQISAGSVDGPLSVKFRAFLDRLISRMIGSFIRSVTLIFGLVFMLLQLVASMVLVVFWLVVPLLPVAGLILMALGWTPWQ
jgi:hypothetical protein